MSGSTLSSSLALGLALLATPLTLHAADAPAPTDPAQIAFFESKVRPLLVEHCYQCHAADAEKGVKGGLLLDSRPGVLAGGELGAVIVPGRPEESLLIKAVGYDDPELQMPPKGKLSGAEIAALTEWVRLGAPDPRTEKPASKGTAKPAGATASMSVEEGRRSLWSVQPLKVVEPPAVKDVSWVRNPIDRFILAKLEERGIAPNKRVDKRKLIRRAYFDLIGLPPTPAEVGAFVADASPDAYEKVVDRLLASPHYGERWASYWLDVARYGESDGYEQDYDRPHAYHYRDFVIKALNADLPYDTFVKWQLAGDEYEPGNPLAMAATGFLTAGVFPTQITEKEFESTRYNQLDDMAGTAGVAFLGLTVGCARCHDHKFDPIPQSDYYRFTSTFTAAIRSDIDLDASTPEEREKAKHEFEAKRAELAAAVAAFEREQLPGKFDGYVAALKSQGGVAKPATWSVLDVGDIKTGGTKLTKLPDGSLLKIGTETPAKDVYTFTARTDATGITAIRVEALAHDSFPAKGPGLAPNGNFVLGSLELTAAPADGSAPAEELSVVKARATHQQDTGSLAVAATIDEDPVSGWAVDGGGIGKDQAAVFELSEPVGFDGGTVLTIRMRFDHPNPQHLIGRPRLSVATVPSPDFQGEAGPPSDVADTLGQIAAAQNVSPEALAAAKTWVGSTLPEYQHLQTTLQAHEATGPAKRVVKVQVTSEGLPPVKNNADDRGYPHFYPETYFLKRGDPAQKNGVATQSFLQVLMTPGTGESRWQTERPQGVKTSYRRRAMAEWMCDTEHGAGHLLARVAVNRLWQHHFGRGIVATPADFGTRGAKPTHPELLDWLASELVRGRWRLKPLHRRIVTSSAYALDASFDPVKAAADPDDATIWRRSVRRLESEAIRDAMLAVSGSLDATMYGPGTLDPAMRRRSVYFQIKRSSLIPMMMVFDAPETLVPIAQRAATTVAPQALLLMNNPQVRQYAVGLATRAATEAGSGAVREAVIAAAYRIALGRDPDSQELADALSFVQSQATSHQQAGRAGAADAAMADLCQTVLCLNEFVYVE
jgi:mono/diheme cytochrome c family protein